MAAFKLNLLTPNGVVAKNIECDSLLIPTVVGQVNVLKEHTHYLSKLDTGILTAKSASGDHHYMVSAGTLKVLKDEVVVLAITSEPADKIDLNRASAAKKKAESKLSGSDTLSDVELLKYQRKLERAEARIKLAYLKGA